MSTVLIYTSPARGHLYPMMDVAAELVMAGHRVVVQTLADEVRAVTSVGAEHRPISAAIETMPLEDFRHRTQAAQLRATMDVWSRRAPLEVSDLRDASAALAPDLLVVDVNAWGAAAFAEASGRPWASFLPYVLPVPSRDAPAFGPGFAPPASALDRLRDRVVWSGMGLLQKPYVARLDAIRAKLGLGPVRRHDRLILRAPLLLHRTAEPFEYPRSDLPETVLQIGPGTWAPPAETPAWLADLPRPRVLVSVSTERQDDGAIVAAALAGLAEEPGSLIVTTAALDPARFGAPHDRVRIERFVPHAQVVREVDVVVTHGGMGTTQRSIAAGVPVCVVPWGRDQAETARRAERSGAGVMLPKGRLTPATLRDAVRQARTLRRGAKRVAQAFAEAGGAPRAVSALEALLHDAPAAVEASTRAPSQAQARADMPLNASRPAD